MLPPPDRSTCGCVTSIPDAMVPGGQGARVRPTTQGYQLVTSKLIRFIEHNTSVHRNKFKMV